MVLLQWLTRHEPGEISFIALFWGIQKQTRLGPESYIVASEIARKSGNLLDDAGFQN